jgi:hypothetical protein
MSTPNVKIRIGIMNSPPATPKMLLMMPTMNPAATAAHLSFVQKCSASSAWKACLEREKRGNNEKQNRDYPRNPLFRKYGLGSPRPAKRRSFRRR